MPGWPRAAGVAALALAALMLCAPSQVHAARAKNGTIAFAARHAGKLVVYTRRSSRSRLRAPLGTDQADQPAFSPQGQRLAFRRFGELGPEIWVSYLGRRGLRRLTSGPRDGQPAWAPAGDAVAFARGPRRRRDVYVIGADGNGLRRLTYNRSDDSSPAWSRNRRIAFVRRSSRLNDDIYVISSRGGRTRRLTGSRRPDVDPAWSPSGRTVLFARGRPGRRDLYTVTSTGAHRRQLTGLPGDESEPTWSPDGRRIAFTYRARGRRWIYVFKPRRRPLTQLSSRFRRLTSSRSASRSPSWQPAGFDPLIAAAGDIACTPASYRFNGGLGTPGGCRQLATSNLLLRMDLSRVLPLGDNQYENGELVNFRRSYDPSWGRMKDLTSPVPGNHEYRTDPRATGYFDYFNGPGVQTGPAGDRSTGYYSFDLGSWHVLALNSECTQIGGCGANSPQMRWVRAEVAAHPATCTLAYFHRPLFTSSHYDSTSYVRPMWDVLYEVGVDLVLNGHAHLYERFAPQRPDGTFDAARGMRELNVGTGGVGHHPTEKETPNSQVTDEESFGVLKLVLGRGGYRWRFVTEPNLETGDSGASRCH